MCDPQAVDVHRICCVFSRFDGVCVCVLPFIWTHPPVEYAYRSVAQTCNDERALGITGKAGHTAVCSRWDVLVDTNTKVWK